MELYFYFTKVFALTFSIGGVTGITMSFQLGTNWPGYMNTVGNIAGPLLSSLTAPFVDTRIYDRMFAFPEVTLLIALPLASMMLTLLMHFLLRALSTKDDHLGWMPFAISIFIFVLGFLGLVYSFYPYIIPGNLLIVDAAAAPESLMIILIGTAIVLPCLIGYTALAYWIFRGKATDLSYD
jgi:cytochrome d ubiquinol oxidase subunit II